ncbi:MAG: Ig-like domain-containing protein [Desulfuromusa sp.]|nr:Ig-like domain-containing protein [Desulfuromusa sp.]
MNRFLAIIVSLFALLSLCLLSACGGGGGGDSSGTSRTADDGGPSVVTTLSGTVADGYLRDARVFLDRNNNRVYDNGEPTAQSTTGGSYSLNVNPGDGNLYPVVAQVVAGQTIDEDSGAPVVHSYLLESLPGHWQFVSPLTTLVTLERDKNPSFSQQQAEISVRSQLGIADSVSLFADYITFGSVDADLAAEYNRTHRVAQTVANLMGSLRASISRNLGGVINNSEQRLVSYMVSDQILWQSALIEEAFNNERNLGSLVDVVSLTNDIAGEINTVSLDIALLALYQQRVEQNFDIWDMLPPQVQSLSPPAGDTASVGTIISLSFDEFLDETLLDDNSIELSGPNGLVSGSLNYDSEHKRLTFIPGQLLIPFSNYQVTVNGRLADILGNSLGENITWTFTTIFDQMPPPLPDF